jgi:hypothetical protein
VPFENPVGEDLSMQGRRTEQSHGLRPVVERLSYPLLVRLHAMPRWFVTGGLALLLVAGLLLIRLFG